uniref:Ig-like domain-containing protein n=1 Tax=Rhodnius prolixus TaxID=13249 RepID=T1HRM5_RHOPR
MNPISEKISTIYCKHPGGVGYYSEVGWLKAEDQTILSLHTRVVTHNARVSVTHDNQRTWRLHIRQLKESDRGCYMCQINTNVMKKQIGCVDVHGSRKLECIQSLLIDFMRVQLFGNCNRSL